MPFPQLDRFKSQDPEVADLLSALEVYLEQVLHRPPQDFPSFYQSPSHDISPRWVANELKTNIERAYALLYMVYQAGLIRPRYDVYCPDTNAYIESYPSFDQLPPEVECDHHGFPTTHDKDTYRVNLFFEFSPAVVQGEMRMAV
jgi:hypothetical protein